MRLLRPDKWISRAQSLSLARALERSLSLARSLAHPRTFSPFLSITVFLSRLLPTRHPLPPPTQFQDIAHLQALLDGNGNASGYGPFVPTLGAQVPTYAINLNTSGVLPEPTWCVPQQSLRSACSTGGRFDGEISS